VSLPTWDILWFCDSVNPTPGQLQDSPGNGLCRRRSKARVLLILVLQALLVVHPNAFLSPVRVIACTTLCTFILFVTSELISIFSGSVCIERADPCRSYLIHNFVLWNNHLLPDPSCQKYKPLAKPSITLAILLQKTLSVSQNLASILHHYMSESSLILQHHCYDKSCKNKCPVN